MQLAPPPGSALHLDQERLPLQDWLAQVHPADREELHSRLQDLQLEDVPLLLCVRLRRADGDTPPAWYRLQGQAIGVGRQRRLVGFMLDISDIKNQEQLAAAHHARLDNLIASSPAVIYVQRYVEKARAADLFRRRACSRCWAGPSLTVHARRRWWSGFTPRTACSYFERTRLLLREGSVRARYRLRDSHRDYHWLLDEAGSRLA